MKSNRQLLELINISKSFGNVKSLIDINLSIGDNEIVGLLGDNGAGKSTLIKIITGYHKPDKGHLFWNGKEIKNPGVQNSQSLGIETVYQERALADAQTIWRNIFIGRELTTKYGLLDINKMKDETEKLMLEIGFTSKAVKADTIIRTMSGGERQGIAIARALYFDAKLVILDEPTTGLSLVETKKTLEFIKKIKAKKRSAIFIDHNIFHVFPIADRIIIIDRGQIICEIQKGEKTLQEVIDTLYAIAQKG